MAYLRTIIPVKGMANGTAVMTDDLAPAGMAIPVCPMDAFDFALILALFVKGNMTASYQAPSFPMTGDGAKGSGRVFVRTHQPHPQKGSIMKKRFALLLVLVLLTAGCSQMSAPSPEPAPSPPQSPEPTAQGITTNQLEFTTVNPVEIWGDAAMEPITDRGYSLREVDGETYLQIFAGEKPSSGHYISVIRVEDVEGTLQVTVSEIKPEKDVIVTYALTYPQTTIRLEGSIPSRIAVANEGGDPFTEIFLPN